MLDGGLTLFGLNLEVVEEVNPLMDRLILASPQGFMVVKFLIPLIFSLLLWKKRHQLRKHIVYLLGFVFALYTFVMLLHAYWIVVLAVVLWH